MATEKSAHYLEGYAAASVKGATFDDNPYRGAAGYTKMGLAITTPESSDWACGFRDGKDAIHVKKHGKIPELGDFVSRRGRRWGARRK